MPALLDRANNRRITEGGPGYVTAYTGITLLEVPEVISRSAGDIHVQGNPHVHTDPLNAILISRNILTGLERVAPDQAAEFGRRQRDFERRVLEALLGPELVSALTPATAFSLLRSGELMGFLEKTVFQGAPLTTRLGGWLKKAAPLRGQEMVCYHKEWAYFTARFGIRCAEYIEAKPGIPPTPGHVRDVIALMRQRRIKALFASNYFNRRQITTVAERTGAQPVIVTEHTDGHPGVHTYFQLVDMWIDGLLAVYR